MLRLKELRLEKGLTQQNIATAINISVKTYARYEQGRREPDINTLKALSKFHKASIDHMVGNDTRGF